MITEGIKAAAVVTHKVAESSAFVTKEVIGILSEALKDVVTIRVKFISELPEFAKNAYTEAIKTFTEADKPLNRRKGELSNTKKIKTINEQLDGKRHPVTNVPFEKVSVETDLSEQKEAVLPQFESYADVKLPENLEKVSDGEQKNYCNQKLNEKIENNEIDKSPFSKSDLERLKDGKTPRDYIWHHDGEKGKMQLVDMEIHKYTAHTGGRNIWGGGTDNR